MAYYDLSDKRTEEKRNPQALENQQQFLKNQGELLKVQQRTNELQEDANRIREQQLEAQQTANELTAVSIGVQKEISQIQRQYYHDQIKIDSKMLAIAEEHAERERNITFCSWCGRQMPIIQAIDYLDIEACSLQCKKMYRQHVIEENRLMFCDCCGGDLVLEVVEKDYDNVVIGSIASPLNDSMKIPVTLGDVKVLDKPEELSAITAYLDKFNCCTLKCLAELLSKDATITDICSCLSSRYHSYAIYNLAMQKFHDCCFEEAVTLFDSIVQYSDAPEKSEECKQLIAKYTGLVNDTAVKIEDVKTQIDDIVDKIKEAMLVSNYLEQLENLYDFLQSIKEDFLNAVPPEHRKYKPIQDLLTSIREIEELFAEINKKRSNNPTGCLIAAVIVFFIIIIIIAISQS